jgi:hypothetical protein
MEEVWYQQVHGPQALDREEKTVAMPSSHDGATDCAVEHAPDRLLVQEATVARDVLATQGLVGQVEVVAEWPGWEVWQFPDGQACELMQLLNRAGFGAIAELDVVLTAH